MSIPTITIQTTRKELENDFNLVDLKDFAKKNFMGGYSSLTKDKLISWICDLMREKRRFKRNNQTITTMENQNLSQLRQLAKRCHFKRISRMRKTPLIKQLLKPIVPQKTTRKSSLNSSASNVQSQPSHIEDLFDEEEEKKKRQKQKERIERMKRLRKEEEERKRKKREFWKRHNEIRNFWEVLKIKRDCVKKGYMTQDQLEQWIDSNKPHEEIKKKKNEDLKKEIEAWNMRIQKASSKGLEDLKEEFIKIRNEKIKEFKTIDLKMIEDHPLIPNL